MRWWLLYWAVASAVFFIGWVVGVVMARTKEAPAPASGTATYCWRCYVDLVSERVAGEAAVVTPGVATPPSRVP